MINNSLWLCASSGRRGERSSALFHARAQTFGLPTACTTCSLCYAMPLAKEEAPPPNTASSSSSSMQTQSAPGHSSTSAGSSPAAIRHRGAAAGTRAHVFDRPRGAETAVSGRSHAPPCSAAQQSGSGPGTNTCNPLHPNPHPTQFVQCTHFMDCTGV